MWKLIGYMNIYGVTIRYIDGICIYFNSLNLIQCKVPLSYSRNKEYFRILLEVQKILFTVRIV